MSACEKHRAIAQQGSALPEMVILHAARHAEGAGSWVEYLHATTSPDHYFAVGQGGYGVEYLVARHADAAGWGEGSARRVEQFRGGDQSAKLPLIRPGDDQH